MVEEVESHWMGDGKTTRTYLPETNEWKVVIEFKEGGTFTIIEPALPIPETIDLSS